MKAHSPGKSHRHVWSAKRILQDSPAWRVVEEADPEGSSGESGAWLTPSGIADYVYARTQAPRVGALGCGKRVGRRMHEELFTFIESQGTRQARVEPDREADLPDCEDRAPDVWTGIRITANPDGTTTSHIVGASPQETMGSPSLSPAEEDYLEDLDDGLDNLLAPHSSHWAFAVYLGLLATILGSFVMVVRVDARNYGVPLFPLQWAYLEEPAWIAVIAACILAISRLVRSTSSRLERLGKPTYIGTKTAPLMSSITDRLRGRPDLVVQRGRRWWGLRGTHFPVEYKTTPRPAVPHAHDVAQLAAYGLLVKAEHGRYPRHAYLIYANGEPIQISLVGAKTAIMRIIQAMRA